MKHLQIFILIFALCLSSAKAQDIWQKIGKIYGNIPASAVAVHAEGHIIVGSLDGTVYRSTSDGNNWVRIKSPLPGFEPIQSIIIDPEQSILAITHKGEIFRSQDKEEHWTRIDLIENNNTNFSFLKWHSDAYQIHGQPAGISRSQSQDENSTASYFIVPAGKTRQTSLSLNKSNKDFAGTFDGIVLISSSTGKSSENAKLSSFNIRSLAANSEGDLFAGTSDAGILRSQDNGNSWIQKNNGLANSRVLSLAVGSEGVIFAGVSHGMIFRSTDNGESWASMHTIQNAYGIWALASKSNGDLFAATDAGVFHYKNSIDDWTQTGLVNVNVRTVASNSSGHIFAGTFGSGIYRSTDGGNNWTQINTGLTPVNILTLAIEEDGDIYTGTVFGGIYRSIDNGDTWALTNMPDQTFGSIITRISGQLLAGTLDFLGANTIDGIFYSSDDGNTWNESAFSGDANAIATDDSGNVYAGFSSSFGSGVYRTTSPDPDSTWAPYWWRDSDGWFSPSPVVVPRDVMSVMIDGDGDVFAGTFDGGVYRLIDTTWTASNVGLLDSSVLSLATTDLGHIYTGNFNGNIFRSNDGGDSWMLTNTGMTNFPVTSFAVSPSRIIFAGTNGDGVFQDSIPPLWTNPITLQAISSPNLLPEINQFVRVFGGHPDATDGFDTGIDVVAAPPAFDYYAYFSIPVFPNFLATDYRGWLTPFETDIDWTLQVVNATGITSEMTWVPDSLPPEGSFKLKEPLYSIDVNMRKQSSVQFTGDANLTIEYRPIVCVTFDFPVTGGAWYLISLPVVPDDNSVASVFPVALGAFEWDFLTSNYVAASTLEPCKGYWLLMLEATTVEVCGQPVYSCTYNYVEQGWDLIGSVLETSPLVADPPGSVIAMFGWDALAQNYAQVNPFVAEPQQGYWILVFGVPSTVTVGGGQIAMGKRQGAKMSEGVELAAFYEKFGTLPPPPPSLVSSDQHSETSLPADYSLSQNYPNPFNPETKIEYALPQEAFVRIKIYSVLGQRVRSLIEKQLSAGYHTAIWDGKDDRGFVSPGGVYLVRMRAGDFAAVLKITLLK